jgi:hypothetical protein
MDREILIGTTTGATLMFGFGVVWLLLGVFRGARSPTWVRLALLIAGIVLAASIVALGRRASTFPRRAVALSAQQITAGREVGRRFYIVAGIEFAAMFIAVVVLRALHFPDYILCAIALIVGIHFLPLAPLFKSPLYYVTGSVGCLIGLAGFLTADNGRRQKIVGLSFGLMLWATAAWIAGSTLISSSSGQRELERCGLLPLPALYLNVDIDQ